MAPTPNRILRLELVLPLDSTPDEREETILRLRRELLETDVLAVENDARRPAARGRKRLCSRPRRVAHHIGRIRQPACQRSYDDR